MVVLRFRRGRARRVRLPGGVQVEGDSGYNPSFTPGSLALYTCVYLVLMSIGAGLAIPGGLFMPSIVVRGPDALPVPCTRGC